MKMTLLRTGALALALLSCAPALAQGAVGKAIIAPLGTSIPAQAIYCDDGSGNAALCTFGGGGGGGTAGTEYTEDAVAPANPIGGIVQARRRDTLTTSEVSADGDVISLNATSKGELRVNDAAVLAALAGTLNVAFASTPTVNIGTAPTIAVTGTFWQATQPVSAATLPLPSGAATSAAQGTGNNSLASIDGKLPASLGAKAGSASLSVAPATDAIFPADTVVRSTSVDRGGIFGTTSATLMASNPSRRGFSVQVQAASSVSCYISGLATATTDYHSLQIVGGSYFVTEPSHVGTGAVSIVCSAASINVYGREW